MNFLSLRPYLDTTVAGLGVSRQPIIKILGPDPSTQCALATFGAALSDGLEATGVSADVAATPEELNGGDVAVIHYECGEDVDGVDVVEVIAGLRVPSIVIIHSLYKDPAPQQRSALEAIVSAADHVVVMSRAAHERLNLEYTVDRRKVSTIPHGATVAHVQVKRSGRPTLLTFGLLRPGKGIERVIDAMEALRGVPGNPRYLVVGRTDPKVLAAEGEAYRESLIERAKSRGVAGSVTIDANYRSTATLSALIQSSAAVVLPHDSTDQVTSGVLVDAMANGRPIVTTAFPHAVELLSGGAGIIVPHDDPEAMVSTLHRVLTQPRLAGSMAAEARLVAPTLAWPVVADAYLALAQRLVAERRALV